MGVKAVNQPLGVPCAGCVSSRSRLSEDGSLHNECLKAALLQKPLPMAVTWLMVLLQTVDWDQCADHMAVRVLAYKAALLSKTL